ncbi:uncharacterized protein si:dkey-30e9.6 isoform X1 [Acanthochromis polyacanthus]|uniref:uncharacterized protein si:dkey-30e9.6 isoform X1 n=2 Tax=Acanthochromis polyacanthus TaxID=80966 RepID=UPI002234C8A8|nr:uncharacterized protein si:dkey-30e9.6 isoform X1 [Acanthochromis polyacanthus]
MAPCGLLYPLSLVSFERKMQFTASQELSFTRSTFFKLAETESQSNVWSIKPPDFSLKLYRCMSGSQKKEGKTKTKLTVPQCGETKRRTGIFLPNVVHVNPERKDPPKFITSYRALDALESELMFVKTGKYNSGPYKNPKPHNFRPVDEDLPDIITAYERDPGSLHLKLASLDTLWPTRSETDFNCRATKTQMNTYKPPEPKWDPELILPPLPWPPKSASFTRHRRRRGAYSAFLDRVEEKLCRQWENKS